MNVQLGKIITYEQFEEKGLEFMDKFDAPINGKIRWLQDFLNRHKLKIIYEESQNFRIIQQMEFIPLPYEKLDTELHDWFQKQKDLGKVITYEQLKEKAWEFIGKFGGRVYSNRSQWLRNFVSRHKLEIVQEKSQKNSQSLADKFSQTIIQRIEKENISKDNIYSMLKLKFYGKLLFKICQ